jgi:phosphate transport system protein
MTESRFDEDSGSESSGQRHPTATSHPLREQDALWSDFLDLAASVVEALEKSVLAVCDGRFDLIADVEHEEDLTDRREVLVEQECLRILALYEPVASDLRRMATVLKVNRDWERIADLALRVARRSRKLSGLPRAPSMPEPLKKLARDVLDQVRSCLGALAGVDGEAAREVIAGDGAIDAQFRTLRREFKAALSQHPEQLDAWLLLMSMARNLERIADHACGIAQTVVYLREGVIIRHTPLGRSSDA